MNPEAQGLVIYPGKVSDADCFRIGTIGHLLPDDARSLIAAIRRTLEVMQIDSPRAARAGDTSIGEKSNAI